MAKPLVLSGSSILEVSIRHDGTILVAGKVLDDTGVVVSQRTERLGFDDPGIAPNVRNTINTAMRHLSRWYNNKVADEDTDTWQDL